MAPEPGWTPSLDHDLFWMASSAAKSSSFCHGYRPFRLVWSRRTGVTP